MMSFSDKGPGPVGGPNAGIIVMGWTTGRWPSVAIALCVEAVDAGVFGVCWLLPMLRCTVSMGSVGIAGLVPTEAGFVGNARLDEITCGDSSVVAGGAGFDGWASLGPGTGRDHSAVDS